MRPRPSGALAALLFVGCQRASSLKGETAPLGGERISLHCELMFTRSLFETADLIEQHKLLPAMVRLVDAGERLVLEGFSRATG